MFFYIINLGLLSLIMYTFRKKEKIMLGIVFLWLFFLLAFRGKNMGADYAEYLKYFEIFSQSKLSFAFLWGIEEGYVVLNKTISELGGNYQVLLAIVAMLSLVGVFYFIKQYSTMPRLSIWFFITLGGYMNIFTRYRQSIAISIVLIGYKFAIEKKPTKFLSCIFVAMLFHRTAGIAIIMYPLLNLKRLKKSVPVIICGFLVLINLLKNQMIKIVFTFLPSYADKYQESYTEGEGTVMLLVYILMLCTILYIMYYRAENVQWRGNYLEAKQTCYLLYLFHFAWVSIALQILAQSFKLMSRAGEYFAIPFMLLFTNVISYRIDKKSQKILKALFYIISLLFFIYITYSSSWMIPYKFIWQN